MGALFVWSLGYMLEFLGVDIATKLFWAKIQYFGIVALPLAYFWFSLDYSGHAAWLTRTRLASLLIVPISILLLVFTNESHRQLWTGWHVNSIQGSSFLILNHGIAFWVNVVYTYILLAISTLLMINAVTNHPELFRRQIAVILTGIFAPWLGNAISNLKLLPVPIDLTPFGFTLTGLAIVWSIIRHNFMDITPIAYETVFGSMNDAVFILDRRNKIVDINPSALKALNLSANEIIGKHTREAFKDQADILDRFEYTMNDREEIAITQNSQILFYELSVSPLTNRNNTIVGRAVVLHDISDRKQAEATMAEARDQALNANRAKSQFLARISHELRTPLGVIRGYADLLKEPAYGMLAKPQMKAVNEIIESNERISDMVSELLDEARLAAGAVQLEIKPFSPTEILEDAQRKLSILAKQKKLALTIELDPELPLTLYGDPTRINQMVTNLTSNSIKFTGHGGVTIKFYCVNKKQWAIDVIDTGPGIPKSAQKSIFEPFRQADNTITRKFGGTGLGLSIVKHLTILMGGKIEIKSEINKGSTFTITLPMNTKAPE